MTASAALDGRIDWYGTFAQLVASQKGPMPFGTRANTSDQKEARWNGAAWEAPFATAAASLYGKWGNAPLSSILNNSINPFPPPYFRNVAAWIAAPLWLTATVYAQGAVARITGGQLLVAKVGGTSGGSMPTVSFTALITDNTVSWSYYGQSCVTSDVNAPTITSTATLGGMTEYTLYATAANQAKVFLPYSNPAAGTPWINRSSSYFNIANYLGFPAASGFGNLPNGQQSYGQDIEFYTDAAKFGLSYFNSVGTVVEIEVDGRPLEENPTPWVTGNPAYYIIDFSTTTGRKKRHVRIRNVASTTRGILMATVQDGFWPSERRGPTVMYVGDSMAGDPGGAGPTPRNFLATQICAALGFNYHFVCGNPGGGWLNPGNNQGFNALQLFQNNNFPSICNPDCLIFTLGFNDSALTPALVQAQVVATLTLARAQMAGVLIVVMGVIPGSNGPSAANIACENAISAAVTQFGDGNTVFVPLLTDPVGSWQSGTGKQGTLTGTGNADYYVSSDGVHPSLVGQFYLAQRFTSGIWNSLSNLGRFNIG